MCDSKKWVHSVRLQLSVEILQLRPIISRQQERKNNEALISHQIDKVVFHSVRYFTWFIWIHRNLSKQSHYIEVAQEGISSRAKHNWLWIFSPFWDKIKKNKKKNYKRFIMQLFSTNATIFKRKNKFLSAQITLVSTFLQMFIVLGMYNFGLRVH